MPRRKLTAQFVEKVRPPDRGRDEHFDTMLPSFGLRVSCSGVKSWFVTYRHGRRQRRMTLGRYPILSLAEAREEARKALQRVAAGADPTEERNQRTPDSANTFAAVAEEFIWKYAKPNTRSWAETARILDKDVLPVWGDRQITSISRSDVLCLVDGVVARGAPVMSNHLLAIVRKLFNWAVVQHLVDKPLVAANASAAAVFRAIEAHQPTLVIDEADTFLRDDSDLRGILNSGHDRPNAYVLRVVGDGGEPFSTSEAELKKQPEERSK